MAPNRGDAHQEDDYPSSDNDSFKSFEPEHEETTKPTPKPSEQPTTATPPKEEQPDAPVIKKRLKPNSAISVQPLAQTKASLARDATLKESLRKQYLATNEAVRATEFILPFAFFEAKDMSGGRVRLKKGDFVWLFLERARKVGIELGERGLGPVGLGGRRREWARIGVDDLMCVVGEMVVPHVSFGLGASMLAGSRDIYVQKKS